MQLYGQLGDSVLRLARVNGYGANPHIANAAIGMYMKCVTCHYRSPADVITVRVRLAAGALLVQVAPT
jgi:hypothetical protein